MTAQPWSEPVIVSVTETNPNNRADPQLNAFYADVQTRLAQLEPRQSLRYTFPALKLAERYRNQVRRELTARGRPVRTLVRPTGAGESVYVYITPAEAGTQKRPAAPASKPKPDPAPSPPPEPNPVPASPWAHEMGITDRRTTAAVANLESGQIKWRALSNPQRKPILQAYLANLVYRRLNLTQESFNTHKPAWMPTAFGAMQNFAHTSWIAFLDELQAE